MQYHSQLIKNVREAMSQTHSPSPVAIAVELGGQGVRCGCFLPVSICNLFFFLSDQFLFLKLLFIMHLVYVNIPMIYFEA